MGMTCNSPKASSTFAWRSRACYDTRQPMPQDIHRHMDLGAVAAFVSVVAGLRPLLLAGVDWTVRASKIAAEGCPGRPAARRESK